MNWKELKQWIDKLTPEQQEMNITIHDGNVNRYHKVCNADFDIGPIETAGHNFDNGELLKPKQPFIKY